MLVHQQVRESELVNVDEIPGQSTKSKSTKIPTHFTTPQENQSKKNNAKNLSNKMKNKKSVEDKQFRKLNKQSKKVKSLQEQYRELEEQIKQVKQMVNLQLQLINHTVMYDNQSEYGQNIQLSNKYEKVQQLQGQCQIQENNQQKVDAIKLQELIKSLFSYQQTIQAANSNYLLLSQVNKQQQSQSLLQINSLQDRIRQLRFLLNGKQDLLAYELATMDNTNNQTNQQQDDMKPICIDYHMPKKMTMANQHNMQSQYRSVEKAVMEMGRLKSNVNELQNQLRMLQYTQNDKENEEEDSNQVENKKDSIIQGGCMTLRSLQKSNNLDINHNFINILNPSLTTRTSPQSAISKTISLSQNIPHLSNNKQLQFLPLSTTNYKSSLIYKVAKLNQIQHQKGQQLKQTYKQLMKEYQLQIENKKKIVSQYQIQRDIYQYKKKQFLNNNKIILKGIEEQQQEEMLSQKEVNLDNILAEIHQQQQKDDKSKQQQQLKLSRQTKSINKHNQTTLITVRSSQQSSTQQTNFYTVQSSPQTKDNQQNTVLFNQITNTPQKQTNKKINPFLKLKLKSSYQKQQQLFNSNQNSPKNTISKFTPSRFSLQKQYDKENPSIKKQGHLLDSINTQNMQSIPTKQQMSNFNPTKDPSYNTPTKRRRPSTLRKAQSAIYKQFSSIEVKN